MPASQKYDWFPIHQQNPEVFKKTVEAYHHIVQNVAAVGRSYMESNPTKDSWADSLVWVPGLWRMAGKWVQGSKPFRSSLSFKDFSIYLVDQKVDTLGSFYMEGKSYYDAMIWLEEQIISQELSSKNLSTELPYEVPAYAEDNKKVFRNESALLGETLGGFYHDAFILLTAIKEEYPVSTEILVFPRCFDMEIKILLKETGEMATNTYVRLGFSPGDTFIPEPHLYINSWPNLTQDPLPTPPTTSYWHKENWVGLVLPLYSAIDKEDQHDFLLDFYKKGLATFSAILLD